MLGRVARRRPPGSARERRRGAGLALVGVLLVVSVAGAAALVLRDGTPEPVDAASAVASATSSPATTPPTPSPSPTPTTTKAPTPRRAGTLPTVRRLTAEDRHALSVAASRRTFRDGTRAPVVYLVGDDAVDLGWAAVPAAVARGGAVLLTPADRLPESTARELARLRPEQVVVVGDAGAVSEAVATAARRVTSDVVRVDHAQPDEVAREVARAAFPTAQAVWVASGDRPTDLAVAAATAAARRSPLLVVDGDAGAAAPADVALMRDLGVGEVTVVGGPKAVSAGIVASLTDALGSGAVARAEGRDAPALAARVPSLAWDGDTPASAHLARPDRPTDALAGAFLAGWARSSLQWTSTYCLPPATRRTVVARTVARVVVVGGERTVRSLVDRLEPCRSTDDPSSTWVLVNKRNGLSPKGFVPSDLVVPRMPHTNGQRLRSDAAAALARMAAASVEAGAGSIGIDTAFRSYETQDALYDTTLARRGRTWTDTWYLRPGYSEHQTGLTVDLLPIDRSNCTVNDCIDETPQGAWLARNAWRFGFLLRYEKGRTSTTGVGFEPWHFRYVGTALAGAYHDGGWHTYEEFLGRPPAPTY